MSELGRVWWAVVSALLVFLAVAVPKQAWAQTIDSTCRLAEPNSHGQHVSEICWFQFGAANTLLPSGSALDYNFSLPDGSLITLGIEVSGGTHAQPGLQVRQAPTWTGSNFSGNSGYYTILTPNSAALNSEADGRANGVVLTVSDIRLYRPDGSEVTNIPFEIVFADAERLNANPERLDFGVTSGGTPFEILEWLGTANPNTTIWSGTPGADTGGVASACWSSGAPVGVDCRRFRGLMNQDAPAVVLSTRRDTGTSAPFTVTGQIHSSGGQGFAIGVRWGSLRLRKLLPEGRIDSSDQFTYRLTNSTGTVVAQNTTTGSGTSSPLISTTAMPGNIFTIEEVMAPGSASVLGQYRSWVRCEGGAGGSSSVIIDQAYNQANPPQINLDESIDVPGYNIDCEITNEPADFDLTVHKTLSQIDDAPLGEGNVVLPGSRVAYEITIANVGATEAILPVGAIVESLPPGTALASTTTDFACYLNSCSNAAALTIPAGSSSVLTFVVDVDDPLDAGITSILNNVAVSGVDCASSGNTCEHEVPVSREANLSITKTNDADHVVAGAETTYTIVVTNHGPYSAHGATVTDSWQAPLDCTAGPLTCAAGGTSGTACPAAEDLEPAALQGGLAIPSLPSGGEVTFSLTCSVPAP